VGILLNIYNCAGCEHVVSDIVFHNLEFWSTFVFNLVSMLAIFYSPKRLSNSYSNPAVLKIFVLSSICLTFVSSLLVSINLGKFEIVSHELEYVNELSMSMIDIFILRALLGTRGVDPSEAETVRGSGVVTLLLGTVVAAVQLGIYNFSGWNDGESNGEQLAHFFEFAFGIFSAGVTFWFTVDSKLLADKRLAELMYRAVGEEVLCGSNGSSMV
jgi:hypothetical protein